MKTLKLHHLLIACSFFLASCATVDYLGDKYEPTAQTDVYYDAKDVKKEYKVIGHLSTEASNDSDFIKKTLLGKANAIGADGIIILQTTGAKEKETARADAIRYTVRDN
jgi:CobQ-like glutamine amidotransferase family enzyme